MASGHANRAHRSNTWPHRPATGREILLAKPPHMALRCRSRVRAQCPFSRGGLKGSRQQFSADARDGVDGDGPKLCSTFQCGGERGVVGALAARPVAQGDWASVWQAVIVDLLSGGAAWRHPSCAAATLATGIDTYA